MARAIMKRSGAQKASVTGDLSAMVQKKAYELYEKRGKKPGHAMDDWLEAERLVRHESRF